ncbi:uncharacterized protein LOC106062587 [Biomphalaria glabrata]|uniref:Uncharacterized protein LOC106062587 n=1 Tax=Biomphalaria glabrata TaxID=6526 RepID=A0A9W3ABH3_BIOGL|nr:uncharacterized protein LOC106062587 [Biomphalaria glabrata]
MTKCQEDTLAGLDTSIECQMVDFHKTLCMVIEQMAGEPLNVNLANGDATVLITAAASAKKKVVTELPEFVTTFAIVSWTYFVLLVNYFKDCPAGFHGSNCSLQCSSNCKENVCNHLGYCISCQTGYTGLYCEKGQAGDTTESSGLTFPAGVGVGVAVGAVVVVLIVVVVAVVCRRRRKRPQPQSHEEPKRGTRLHAYDGVKKINEYSHSYEETFAPDKFQTDEVKTDNKTVKTSQDPPNSIYDNIEECTSLGE